MTLFSPRDLLLRTIYTREGGSNQILGTRFVKKSLSWITFLLYYSKLLTRLGLELLKGFSNWNSATPCPPLSEPLLYTLLSSDNIAIFQACLAERTKHAIIISFFTLLVSVSHTVKWHFSSVTGNLRTYMRVFLFYLSCRLLKEKFHAHEYDIPLNRVGHCWESHVLSIFIWGFVSELWTKLWFGRNKTGFLRWLFRPLQLWGSFTTTKG